MLQRHNREPLARAAPCVRRRIVQEMCSDEELRRFHVQLLDAYTKQGQVPLNKVPDDGYIVQVGGCAPQTGLVGCAGLTQCPQGVTIAKPCRHAERLASLVHSAEVLQRV